MKTYDEKAQAVFEKIEKYKQMRIIRKKKIRNITVISTSLCIVIIASILLFNDKKSTVDPDRPLDSEIMIQHNPLLSPKETEPTESTFLKENTPSETIPDGTLEPTYNNDSIPIETSPIINTEPIHTEMTEQTEITITEPTEFTENNPGENIDFFYIVIDGDAYYQIFDSESTFSIGAYLGRAMDFNGFYKDTMTDGAVYQSNENEKILLIYLDNGEVHILMCYE